MDSDGQLCELFTDSTLLGQRQAVAHIHTASMMSLNHPIPINNGSRTYKKRVAAVLQPKVYEGEALMKEFLSLIVSTDDYMDNVRPGFLRNTKTDSLMEFDRYYPNTVAFEFNGTQHYEPTDLYDAETVERQQSRDILKKQICADKGVELVIVHPQDLTLAGMLSKVRGLLPLRNLKGGEGLVRFLEKLSANYLKHVPSLPQRA